jgi:Holliday junction resolvase
VLDVFLGRPRGRAVSAAALGAAAEREARHRLEALGYFVVRGAGSKGNADLVAIAPGGRPVLLVQVKRGEGRLRPPEWNELYRLAREYGAVPILAERVPRLPMRWFRLEGLKVVGGRGRQPLSTYDPAPELGAPVAELS